jgi:hypothetical protein
LRSHTRPRSTLAALAVLFLLILVSRAFAEGDLQPPDLPPEPDEGSCTMLETHAPTILSYWWLVSGALASAVGIGIHWVKARGVARHWRGDQPTWVQFWILPVVIATVSYGVVCGAFMIYISRACPVVGHYFESNFGSSHVLTFLGGELLAILPALIFAFRGRGTPALATGER